MSERDLAEVFVELADTLVDDFDLIDFLYRLTVRCVDLLGVTAAGLLLTDRRDALQVVAASTEQTRLLELLQLQTDEGPCPECFHTGRPVTVTDLAAAHERWPRFAAAARRVGFASVHALPMRLRTEVIGALNLFDTRPGALPAGTVRLGQAFADVATIGLQRRQLDMDQSFTLLRTAARNSNRRLSDLSRAVVDGSETLGPGAAATS
jgi:hypothetical protein